MTTQHPTTSPTPENPDNGRDRGPITNGRVLITLYGSARKGPPGSPTYPTWLRRVLLANCTRDTLADTVVNLLQERGPHHYVHVQIVPTAPPAV